MNILKKMANKTSSWLLGSSALIYSKLATANLPTARTSTGADTGDYIGLGTEVAGDGAALVIQLVGVAILVGAAWATITSFLDVQNKKSTYGDFGKTLAGGLAACVIGIILINQASSIF